MKAKHKYSAKAVTLDAIHFPSKLEARYYQQLKLRQKAGEVVMFLRQVPIHLPGNTKLVVDFVEFRADGTVHFVETKGMETEAFKIKRRMVEDLYPIEIELVKKV